MLRVALLAAIVLVALAPAEAQQPADAPVLVVFHAWPDPEAGHPDVDPFSTPDALPLPGLRPDRLPATRADGVLDADPAPEGNPDSSVAHARELQRIVNLRAATGAPVVLDVDGALEPGALRVAVNATAAGPAGEVELRAVLVEDGMPFDAGGGARQLRFVARLAMPPHRGNLSEPGRGFTFEESLAIPPGVDASRVGVVVSARLVATGEVAQSAWWTPRQEGPTHQVAKAVLVEHVTATWCDPCGPSDQAIDLLAARSAPASLGAARYVRAPTLWALAGATAGVGAFVLLVRRRAA